jgi:hypothetical protein
MTHLNEAICGAVVNCINPLFSPSRPSRFKFRSLPNYPIDLVKKIEAAITVLYPLGNNLFDEEPTHFLHLRTPFLVVIILKVTAKIVDELVDDMLIQRT